MMIFLYSPLMRIAIVIIIVNNNIYIVNVLVTFLIIIFYIAQSYLVSPAASS